MARLTSPSSKIVGYVLALIFAAAVSTQSLPVSAQDSSSNPESLTKGASSVAFHRFRDLIDQMPLSGKCKKLLGKFYRKGGNLSTPFISKQLITLQKWKESAPKGRPPLKGMTFYHYTKTNLGTYLHQETVDRSQAELMIRADSGYERIFDFLKTRSPGQCCGAGFTAALFVAADPWSSRQFGPNRVTLELSPDTRVLLSTYTGNLQEPNSMDMVDQEIGARSKKLIHECPIGVLEELALEDSGVDLISYESQRSRPWFILLNSGPIQQSLFELSPE